MEYQNSLADASQETKDAPMKSQQEKSTSRSGSAKSQAKGRGKSPGSPKKPATAPDASTGGYGGIASTGEVRAAPATAPDASPTAKDKLPAEEGDALGSPPKSPGKEGEAEMRPSSGEGLASVVDS